MRLYRPHVPLHVRIAVANRQLGPDRYWPRIKGQRDTERLRLMLLQLFPDGEKYHLDHDPALTNRSFDPDTRKYVPDANDPKFLVYRTKAGHDIKTRVRGDGAQLSDLALRRKQKRADEKRKRKPWKPMKTKYVRR